MSDHEKRKQVLQYLYNKRDGSGSVVLSNAVAELALDMHDLKRAAQQLHDLGHAKFERTIGRRQYLSITTDGINEIEGVAGMVGIAPTHVTNNTINTSTAEGNSNVNIGSGSLSNEQIDIGNIAIGDLIQQIEASVAPDDKKQEAKGLLSQLANNQLISNVLGGVISGIVAGVMT